MRKERLSMNARDRVLYSKTDPTCDAGVNEERHRLLPSMLESNKQGR